MDWLSKVAKHHSVYIRNVKAMGVNNHAEDIVQEMYLRIVRYSNEDKCISDGKVNKHYIWRILYSLCKDYHRDANKFRVTSLEGLMLTMEEYNESINVSSSRGLSGALTYIQEDNEREEAYERIMQKLFKEIDKLDNDGYPYNKELFTLYVDSAMSMRKLSKAIEISLDSVFNTLKHCKQHLSDEIREDIEDFNNGEYELIK